MQRLFAHDPMIRRMVDYVPAGEETPRPVMILEGFQKTLWDVRTTRVLSRRETKWIMNGVLLGLGQCILGGWFIRVCLRLGGFGWASAGLLCYIKFSTRVVVLSDRECGHK